jgi:hypothetical protein
VAILLENAGVAEGVGADVLGHDKPTMTYGLYSGGASLKVKREAIEKQSPSLGDSVFWRGSQAGRCRMSVEIYFVVMAGRNRVAMPVTRSHWLLVLKRSVSEAELDITSG